MDLLFYKDTELIEELRSNNLESPYQFKGKEVNTSIDINKGIIIRENTSYIFKLDILNKAATINLLEQNLVFDIKVISAKITSGNNKFIIEYVLETDLAKNKIVLEKKENK